MFDLILTGVQQGLILAFVAYGIMIPFRFLNFPDLTAEGAYPMGGVVCGLLLAFGYNPWLASIIGGFCGGLLGLCTAVIYERLRLNTLLCGIIIAAMAYSLNLRIMMKPNLPLFQYTTVFSHFYEILVLIVALGFFLFPFLTFLKTDYGLRFRAVGLNPHFLEKQHISIFSYRLLGLFFAAFLCSIAGALVVQLQGYVDVTMGVGMVIHGLAGLMLGECLLGTHTLSRQLLAPLFGSLIYQQMQGLILAFGLAPADLKFFTGVVIILIAALSRSSSRLI